MNDIINFFIKVLFLLIFFILNLSLFILIILGIYEIAKRIINGTL